MKKVMRKEKIIESMTQSDVPLPLSVLAEKTGVSERTLYREIKEINIMLQHYGVSIFNLKHQGFYIDGDRSEITSLLRSGTFDEKRIDTPLRRKKILADCLKNRNLEKLSYYAHAFKVAESTISQDLNLIEKWLEKYELRLLRKPGKTIQIEGIEKNIRTALKEFICHEFEMTTLEDTFVKETAATDSVQQQIFEQLGIDPAYIFKTIREYESDFGGLFADEAFNALAIHIAIAIRRIKDGNSVPFSSRETIGEYQKEYDLARKVGEKIGTAYDIKFSGHEIYFLFLHIISTKVVKKTPVIFDIEETEGDLIVKKIAEYVFMMVKNTKQIEIDRKKYFDNLIMHLRPMINRLEYNMKLENPLLEMIKREYPEAYGIAWMTNSIFKYYIGKEISEDEAGFIAVHIASMIEGAKECLRVVVVCSSGIGVAQLIATRLEARYSQIRITAIDSVASFEKKSYTNKADLVLSTFPLQTELPLLLVSPLLNGNDMNKIEDFLYNHSLDKGNIFNSVKLETFLRPGWKTQEEVIRNVSANLEKNGLVKSTFYENIYAREKISSTSVGMKLALPHAAFESVQKSTLVVVTLDQAIMWGSDEVDLIIFIALTKQDATWVPNVLKNMYYKLYFSKSHTQLLQSNTYEEILRILTE